MLSVPTNLPVASFQEIVKASCTLPFSSTDAHGTAPHIPRVSEPSVAGSDTKPIRMAELVGSVLNMITSLASSESLSKMLKNANGTDGMHMVAPVGADSFTPHASPFTTSQSEPAI